VRYPARYPVPRSPLGSAGGNGFLTPLPGFLPPFLASVDVSWAQGKTRHTTHTPAFLESRLPGKAGTPTPSPTPGGRGEGSAGALFQLPTR
jgi:hypothetical protein